MGTPEVAAFEPVTLHTPLVEYGIALVNDAGWIGHNGSVPGYTTLYYHPVTRTAVVVATNSDIEDGTCPGQETLLPDPFSGPCASAADHIMATVAEALGTPYQPL